MGKTKQNVNKYIDKIIAFSKIYGYVRYFHPSDQASNIDWDKFAILGLKKIEFLDKRELLSCFEQLFQSIAPTVQFATAPFPKNYTPSNVFSIQLDKLQTVFWKHSGVKGDEGNDVYYSERIINEGTGTIKEPNIGDCLYEKIGKNLYCCVPLCLYKVNNETLPKVSNKDLQSLYTELHKVGLNDSSIYSKIASIVITWNLIQHFYPNRSEINKWDLALASAIKKSFLDKTREDFLNTINELMANLNDGHAGAYDLKTYLNFKPPLKLQYVNDTIVISAIYDSIKCKSLSVGDIVLNIDGRPSKRLLEEKYRSISASTYRYKKFVAVYSILSGSYNSKINLEIMKANGNIENVVVERSLTAFDYWQSFIVKNVAYKVVNDSTIYMNFGKISMHQVDSLMPFLENIKFIICDLRGYPNGNHEFISHLISIDDTCKTWFRVPQIIYPNYEDVSYDLSGWQLKKKAPTLRATNIFIVNEGVISYGESFMNLVEHYKLGIIIGDSTAGTNGNINTFTLPCYNLKITWTGMSVFKPNGTKFVGVGIIPQIVVRQSIGGIRLKKDELLDKAVDMTLNYGKYKHY